MKVVTINDVAQKEKIQTNASKNKELAEGYKKIQNIIAIQRYLKNFDFREKVYSMGKKPLLGFLFHRQTQNKQISYSKRASLHRLFVFDLN